MPSPSDPTPEKYVALIPVGPDAREMGRLEELVVSLMRFEPAALQRVVLVDDTPAGRDFSAVARLLPPGALRILVNPRQSRGEGWRGGLTANVVFGLAAVREEPRAAYVLRLDTDALVIAPFHERVRRFLSENPTCGLVGSDYLVDLEGRPKAASTWAINLRKWQRPLRFRRNPYPRLEQGLFGINRRIRDVITTAVTVGAPFGYRLGNNVLGAGCALRWDVLDSLAERGWLDGRWWPRIDITDDVMVSLLVTAADWRVRDFNGRGELFGVQYQGLSFPPAELRARGYAVVHSVKYADRAEEEAIRAEFRAMAAA